MKRTISSLFSAVIFAGCVTSQTIEDGLYSAADCTVQTSLACATQAIGGCIAPAVTEPGDGWKNYAVCLWDTAKNCQKAGLARCALAGAVEAAGFPGIGRDPMDGSLIMLSSRGGVPFRCDVDQVRTCVTDARIETKHEAIATVAYCYRHLCRGPNAE